MNGEQAGIFVELSMTRPGLQKELPWASVHLRGFCLYIQLHLSDLTPG